ncbi:hypothetical protein [Rheinheimera sp.]|uniref:hypothetical protein n=1 Tax=Rheinheimera sp. TaxID=1869214 RepID=UPI004047BEAD
MPRVVGKLDTPIQLAIRLNMFEGYEEKLSFFTPGETFESVYGIRHQGKAKNNPHIHFAVESWVSEQTLRARIAKIFDNQKGNKNLSVKHWDGDETYIQYTLKELKDYAHLSEVLVVNSRTGGFLAVGTLEQLHARSRLVANEIKENTPTKICLKIAEQIIESEIRITDFEIFRQICIYLMTKGKFLPNKFQSERWIIQVKVCIAQIRDGRSGGTKSQEDVISQLYHNYFLNGY